jgi:hypothetical protein
MQVIILGTEGEIFIRETHLNGFKDPPVGTWGWRWIKKLFSWTLRARCDASAGLIQYPLKNLGFKIIDFIQASVVMSSWWTDMELRGMKKLPEAVVSVEISKNFNFYLQWRKRNFLVKSGVTHSVRCSLRVGISILLALYCWKVVTSVFWV